MTTDTPSAAGRGNDRLLVRVAMLIALLALCLSVYLAWVSMASGEAPAGCGSASGCGRVLASKWSRWLGLPVSLLASALYVIVLGALAGAGRPRRGPWFVLVAAAGAIVGAGAWFTYVQLARVGALCPYCMAAHGLGLVLAALLLWRAPRRHWGAMAIGLASVVLIAAVQVGTPAAVGIVATAGPGRDSDVTRWGRRTVTLMGGRLPLALDAEPHIGPPAAPLVLASMFDYMCPHCRRTHDVLERVRARYGAQLVIVMLPMPLHRDCNPHVYRAMPARFESSCALARIALAVFLADPSLFEGFHHWMFQPREPWTVEQATAEAIRRAGESFKRSRADPRVERMIERNVTAYGRSGSSRIPILFAPDAPAIYGRIENTGTVIDLLGRPPPPTAR